MRTDDQRRLAAFHRCRHDVAFLFLLAAGKPRHAQAALREQGVQPADQLAEVLRRQDLGRRHQRALKAGVDTTCGCQRSDHRLAGADVALQQPMHRNRSFQVARDLFADTLLRTGQCERQDRHQLRMKRRDRGHRPQRRRLLRGPLAPRLQLRQLLRQQLFRLDALPGWMTAIFERGDGDIRRRVVQERQCAAQVPHLLHIDRHPDRLRQGFLQRGAREARSHFAPQHRLRKPCGGRVHRRQRLGQRRAGRLDGRMHHRAAEEPAAHFAAHTNPRADFQLLLLRRVEVEKAQLAGVAAVVDRHDQLTARPKRDFAFNHHRLDLRQIAFARVSQPHDAGLVFVTHRQVEREVDVAHEA